MQLQARARGNAGRRRAEEQAEWLGTDNGRVRKMLQVVLGHLVLHTFEAWHERAQLLGRVRLQTRRHFGGLERRVFLAWAHRVLKRRNARGRIAMSKMGATVFLQAWWRGVSTRWRTDRMFEEDWGSKSVQRVWRGYVTRIDFDIRFRLFKNARRIQVRGALTTLQHTNCTNARRILARGTLTALQHAIQMAYRCYSAKKRVHTARVAFVLGAAERGEYHKMLTCFENGSAWVVDADNSNALHKACLGCNKRVAKLCLRYQMDINGYNALGKTPLHMVMGSAFVGRDELGSYLIDHGAWSEAPDFNGRTPLLEAVLGGHSDGVAMLARRMADVEVRGTLTARSHTVPVCRCATTRDSLTAR